MINYELRFRVFAMCLAALAGFVDAMGFVLTGGLFFSFMSGNSTRMAVGLAGGSDVAIFAGALVASFLAGVVSSALLAHRKDAWRKAAVMGFTTAVLMLAAVLTTLGHQVGAALILAAAMGSLNNVFLREGEVSIGVTYMTGALVRAGQRIASKMLGRGGSDWLSYRLLWGSLVSGATAGALLANVSLVFFAWIAVPVMIVMTVFASWLDRVRPVHR